MGRELAGIKSMLNCSGVLYCLPCCHELENVGCCGELGGEDFVDLNLPGHDLEIGASNSELRMRLLARY